MNIDSRRKAPEILVLDVGGTHVKMYLPGRSTRVEFPSGPKLTPAKMLRQIRRQLEGIRYDGVAIGYPGLVTRGRIVGEPAHLGKGWVGFDFGRALGHPVQILNDAAMQALGSYRGGRMLFLGLGTGLGSAMIISGELQPMELGHLPWKKGKVVEQYVGEAALEAFGRKKWQKEVYEVVDAFVRALEPEYVVLGGGNVRRLKRLPPGTRAGNNWDARTGGRRLWSGGGRVTEGARRSARGPPTGS